MVGWVINRCVFEAPCFPRANFGTTTKENLEISEYSIIGPHYSFIITEDTLEAFPDIDTVARALFEMNAANFMTNLTIKVSDSLFLLETGIKIPLGPLTIFLGTDDPVPTLSWSGKPSPDFEALNKCFARYTKLKSFW